LLLGQTKPSQTPSSMMESTFSASSIPPSSEAPPPVVVPNEKEQQQQHHPPPPPHHNSASASWDGSIQIVEQGKYHMVVAKPPSVVCHHSDYTGSKSRREIPMLQRVRDALGGVRQNPIHRLDRGASGCLLFANTTEATTALQAALAGGEKTYVAIVRGEGFVKGVDFLEKGWFKESREIGDESGTKNTATTWFRFLAAQGEGEGRPRASLVLCRPETGRWHQIRKHLNGICCPIIGDTSHGAGKTNREWKEKYGLPGERTCLHLLRLKIKPTEPFLPDGIDAVCPLPKDMMDLLQNNMQDVLKAAEPMLEEEGLALAGGELTTVTVPGQE